MESRMTILKTLIIAAWMPGFAFTAYALERGVPPVPNPIIKFYTLPGSFHFDVPSIPIPPTQLGVCAGPNDSWAVPTSPPDPNLHTFVVTSYINNNSIIERIYSCHDNSKFIPLEKVIENTVDGFAKWLAQDRAAQMDVVTHDIQVQAQTIDTLRAQIKSLEERLAKLENH